MNRRQFLKTSAALSATPLTGGCSFDIKLIESLPLSSYGNNATAEEVTAGVDLSGKIALVTGCNSGIGYETMRVLALRGAHVIGTGRDLEKASTACVSVTGQTTPVVLELAELQSVVDCAMLIREMVPQIDILIANAGMIAGVDLEQVDGIEKSLFVNHLGHFVFINRLLDRIKAARQGRVVMVSSGAAFGSDGIEFDNLSGERDYHRRRSYSQSKLANALFSLELAARLKGTSATANALHPGVIKTNIVRNEPGYIQMLFNTFGGLVTKTIAQGAATSCYVAASPQLAGVSGYFFMDCNPISLSGLNHLYDQAMARQLWQVSEQLTAKYLAQEA
ncbi:MAG: SDR family NAD(P)-dependent oxidoreductase [Gammaproteobacteria bacterium]|nr:SDR family NAD(P)-dependent oxidoreductase [Gammaproteobacteria bacterium]